MTVTRHTNSHAAHLRRDMTDAERRLWFALRDRRFAGRKFRRQASIGPYIVDFLCVETKQIIEVDGGQHSSNEDAIRTAFLQAAGVLTTLA